MAELHNVLLFPAFYILKILDNSILSLNTICSFTRVLQIGALEQSTLLKKYLGAKKRLVGNIF